MTDFNVAVAELARFCHRSGDIDHRFSPSPTGPEGIAGHQRLYARRPQGYKREFPVEFVHETAGLNLTLRGRADGYHPQARLVEEIKTCRVPAQSIPEAVARLHLAQGRLYAALIAREEKLPQLCVRVTWLNIDTDEEHHLEQNYNAVELQSFLDNTLERFAGWLKQLQALRRARDESLVQLNFPHGEFRAGQRDIAELAYKCIDQGGQLLLEAPTGIGKTAAVLFPALKALATAKHERLLFITAKTVGRRAAESTLTLFRQAGYRGTALSLTAKETICLSPGKACHGDDCPYAAGYYDKLPAALDAALARPALARADIEELAREHTVCPYELAADLVPWLDTVIADQHYMYSLGASLSAAMDADHQRWTILLDEAHNLPSRARGMYGARLTKRAVMAVKKSTSGTVSRALERVNRRLLELQKGDWEAPDYHSAEEVPEALLGALADFTAAVAAQMADQPTLLQRDDALADLFFDSLHFTRVAQEWGPEFRLRLHLKLPQRRGRGGSQGLVVALNCLDPARLLSQRQQRAHAVIAFSATLSPQHWSRQGLGLGEDAVCSRSPSPFVPAQLRVWLATSTDTRYRQRERTMGELADLLCQWLAKTPGNCIVYFPSYRYRDDCLALLRDTLGERRLWVQAPEEGEERRAQLMDLLHERRDLVAFCILGGIFGEGIDLPGDQLSSVVVVGVGMPQVNRDTRELQAWYQRKSDNAFEYTYLYPGMQKVDQALGRVVRSPDDRGSALLIDPRYASKEYLQLLPPWWEYRQWPPEGAEE